MCIYEEIYYKELAHFIVEAEKSHNLLSANWRSRKASSIIQPQCEDLRTRSSENRIFMSQLK